jgi:excisionase family DNA binding protein
MITVEPWVGVAEVAKHIGVRKESIYRWIDKKGFPAHRAGRLLRFRLSEVDEWVRSGGRDSGDDQNGGVDMPSRKNAGKER